jgi:hypothetical protein
MYSHPAMRAFLAVGVVILAAGCSRKPATSVPLTSEANRYLTPADRSAGEVASGPPPPAEDRLYALSGNWANERFIVGIVAKDVIPFAPAYEGIRAGLQAQQARGEPVVGNEPLCVPNGPIMGMRFGFEVFAAGNRLTVQASRFIRFIDVGATHSDAAALIDTYSGESVAKWDGDALAIDTIGQKSGNEIDWGVPNGGQLHLQERWRLRPDGKLEIQFRVEDPVALTQPWTYTNVYVRRPPPTPVDLGYCPTSLDRTHNRKTGKQDFDLTPPEGGFVPPGADK